MILRVVLFAVFLASSPVPAHVFTARCFENENDIYDALEAEEIDYESYVGLLGLMREKIDLNGRDLFRLEEIPGVTRFEVTGIERWREKNGPFHSIRDLEKIDGFDAARVAAFVRVGKPGDGIGAARLRLKLSAATGFDLSDTPERTDEFRIDTRFGDSGRFYCSAEVPEGGALEISRRYIEVPDLPLNGRITAGDLRPRCGEGLVISRGSLLPSDERVFDSESGRFLFSAPGNLNGIMAEWESGDFRGITLFSMNRYLRLTDTFAASAAGLNLTRDIEAGVSVSRSEFASREGSNTSVRHMSGAHAEIELREASFFGEAAFLFEERAWGGTCGCDIRADKLRFFLDIRRYGPGFAPYHGGGYARSDDTDFELFETGGSDSTILVFPSDHAGEKGTRFKSSYDFGESLELTFSLDQWKEELEGESHYYSGFGIRKLLRPGLEIRFSGKWRELRMESEGNRLGSAAMELRWKPGENRPRFGTFAIIKFGYPEFEAPAEKYGYWWARIEKLRFGPLLLGARLKVSSTDFNDSETWKLEWRLEEKLAQKGRLNVSAKLSRSLLLFDRESRSSDLNIRLKATVYIR